MCTKNYFSQLKLNHIYVNIVLIYYLYMFNEIKYKFSKLMSDATIIY